MSERTEADGILGAALIADAVAHDAGRHDEVGERYDDVYSDLLPIQDLNDRRFAIAFNFWDGWCDARNHDWNFYPGIGRDDWPKLAREIASALDHGSPPSNPLILQRFCA